MAGETNTPPAPRERISLNEGWSFQKGDPEATGDSLSYAKIKAWLLPAANPFRKDGITSAVPSGAAPGENIPYVQPGFDDGSWRKLDLPHDWGVEGPFAQDLPGETGKLPWHGVAWYRKSFDLPSSDKGRNITLELDGAMAYPTVWCNGKFVGGWPYGYASSSYDLTPFVKPGEKNTLAIRLDNPPNSSRWYPGGGIYRNVWLTKAPPVRIASGSVHITTPQVSAQSATIKIKASLNNASSKRITATISARIFKQQAEGSPSAEPVLSLPSVEVKIPAGEGKGFDLEGKLGDPKLWSTDHPELYTAMIRVEEGGKETDVVATTFGIRTMEFTVNDGFHLNGKRVPINGVCMHHDLGALGAAFNTSAMERQIRILKEMGVNAIRTSHNPPAPELLDLCDRMGILVMDELTDCWNSPKKPNGYNLLYNDWSEADLRAFIRRDRNHPCVMLWSIGNEIPEQSSTPPGWYRKQLEEQGLKVPDDAKSPGPEMAARLTRIAHEEDASRPTTVGVSDTAGGYNGFQKGVDVFGYNYKPGEYGKFRKANPDQPLFASETSSTVSSRGEYFYETPEQFEKRYAEAVSEARSKGNPPPAKPVYGPLGDKDGGKAYFQVDSYDIHYPKWATTPEMEFRGQEQYPFVAGEFVWTGFDYLGEPTPYNKDLTNILNYHTPEERAKAEAELKALGKIKSPSRSSYFGIVDLAGFKKDRFYLYQAHWRPDFPMVHILPHWNWPERIGQVTPVHVYTSGDEVELFLNGKTLGRKKKGPMEYRLRWDDVVYQPGELKAVAYKNGKEWAVETVKTTGPASKLTLVSEQPTIKADGKDLAFVTLTVADKDGLLVPRSKNPIHFEIEGPGEIVATDNGDATDHAVFASPDRKAYNGLALVIVKAKPGQEGMITVKAQSPGLKPASATLKVAP